jgi:hypothetical protein
MSTIPEGDEILRHAQFHRDSGPRPVPERHEPYRDFRARGGQIHEWAVAQYAWSELYRREIRTQIAADVASTASLCDRLMRGL